MEDKTAEYAAIFDENIKAHGTDFEAGIAMEECAELIQAISKVRRYGDRTLNHRFAPLSVRL